MKKKLLALLLSFCMVASLSACTQNGDAETTTDPNGTQTGEPSGIGSEAPKPVAKKENSIILGSSTDLTGKFRYSAFGVATPGAADLDIENLTGGLETVVPTKEGAYEVNKTVVKDMQIVDNEDGSRTYTIEIYDDMKLSDGSAVTAKNYLYRVVAFSTLVSDEASSSENNGGLTFVGFNEFKKFDGTNDGATVDELTVSKVFTGLRLLGDYKFSVTVDSSQLPYYYAITYVSFTPCFKDLWFGEYDIADDGNGVYITDGFYEKDGDSYKMAAHIKASSNNVDTTYPYSGPYVVESYDSAAKQAVLKKNDNFKGNYEGTKPSIEKVVYTKIVTETQLDQLLSGQIDVIAGVTGGAATNEAIKKADDSNGGFVYTHYARAGYGKLGFRADFGSVQFDEVRQAVVYCMDRAQFAKDFTGGYGGVVDGPYYTGSWMYKAATEQGMLLNAFDTSADTAISILEEGGWVYNEKGEAYTEGVRYKKIPAAYASENDKIVQSIDGAYKTVKVGDDYYMPLVINWYGTSDNEFSDLLVTGFEQNENLKRAGFCIQKTTGDWDPMMNERDQTGDNYSGTPMYNAFNFATGFTSTVYDYSYNLSINPMYAAYSMFYVCDSADVYMLTEEATPPEGYTPTGAQRIAGKKYGTDYVSLYDQIGSEVTIADVKEDSETGFAYIEKDGKKYELGLDFLSFAMVYNTICPDFGTEDEVYAEWWKYYITRWNAMMPEIPLYSNEYYDVYNASIKGVTEHPTNPYWGPANALIDWSVEVSE